MQTTLDNAAAPSQPAGLALRWTIGGFVGGLIGAAAWAALSYYANIESGWLAIGVGALSGAGVVAGGAGHTAGAFTGVIAAGIALLAIAGGKYASIHFAVQNISSEFVTFTPADIDDDFMLQIFVDEIAEERLDNGESVRWPDPDMTIEDAAWPDDYPTDLQRAANDQLDAMTQEEREVYRSTYMESFNEGVELMTAEIKKQAFIDSFGLLDILFIVFAIGAAFKIAGRDSAAA